MKQIKSSPSLIFFSIVLIYLFSLLLKVTWLGDEGMVLSSALRVLQGEVLYRDFFEFWTPGSVYLAAFLFKIFGKRFIVTRLVFLFCSFFTSILTYRLSKKIIKNNLPQLLPSFLFIFSIPLSTVSYGHHPIALFLATATAWITVKVEQRKTWVIPGFMAGLTLSFCQAEGFATIVGLTILSLSQNKSFKTTCFTFLKIFAGIVLVWLPTLFYFGQKKALAQMFYSTVVFPFSQYHHHNQQIQVSFLWLIITLFYFLFLILGRKKKQFFNLQVILMTILGLGFHILALSAPNRPHTLLSMPFTAILFVYFFQQVSPSIFNFKKFPAHSFLVLFKNREFLKQSFFSNLTLFTLLFLSFDLTYHELPDLQSSLTYVNVPTSTPTGKFYTHPFQAQKVKIILDFIQQNTLPPEFLYIGPYSSIFYFWTDIKNPTSFSQLTPEYNPEWMFKNAVEDLEKVKPRYIILLPSENPFLFDKNNPLSDHILSNYKILEFLPNNLPQQDIVKVQNFPTDAIWIRKPT